MESVANPTQIYIIQNYAAHSFEELDLERDKLIIKYGPNLPQPFVIVDTLANMESLDILDRLQIMDRSGAIVVTKEELPESSLGWNELQYAEYLKKLSNIPILIDN